MLRSLGTPSHLPRTTLCAASPLSLTTLCTVLCPPSLAAAVKAAGKWRQEGKTYEVQDGDIIHW